MFGCERVNIFSGGCLFFKAKLISAFPEKYEIINIDIGIIKIK